MAHVPSDLTLGYSLCSWMHLSAQSQDYGLTSKVGTLSKCGTPCSGVVSWKDRCTESCGAVQLLDADGSLVDRVTIDLSLGV